MKLFPLVATLVSFFCFTQGKSPQLWKHDMILVYKGNVKRPTPTILSSYYKGLILYVFVTASYDYNHHPFWCLTNWNIWRGDAMWPFILLSICLFRHMTRSPSRTYVLGEFWTSSNHEILQCFSTRILTQIYIQSNIHSHCLSETPVPFCHPRHDRS